MDHIALHTADLLDLAATRWGEKPFLVDGQTTLSFSATRERVRFLGAALLSRGVSAGDKVAIWAPNCWEWVIGALATQYIGGTLVTLNTRYRGHEAAQILRLSGARTLITIADFLGTNYPALLADEDCGDLIDIITIDGGGQDAFDTVMNTGKSDLARSTLRRSRHWTRPARPSLQRISRIFCSPRGRRERPRESSPATTRICVRFLPLLTSSGSPQKIDT